MNGGARVLNQTAYPAANTSAERGQTGDCPNCGATMTSQAPASSGFVYAIGHILPQFPDLGVEKEFAQLGRGAAHGIVETNRLIDVLKDPGTAYLARQLCWVFSANDSEAFVLVPRDDAETKTLVEALPRAEQADETVQVVVGTLTAPSPASACARAALPAIAIDQHLTFTMSDFIDATAEAAADGGGKGAKAKADDAFRAAARDLFARLTRRSDNRGMSDEHRAANYVALRYPALYRLAADAHRSEKALVDVQVRRGSAGARRTVSIRPTFRGRRTDLVERYQCVVDVTDRFPFLAASLAPVYD